MKIVGGQITGCPRLRPAADADHYVLAGNSVAPLQPAFANFGFTKQSLTKDCSQPEAVRTPDVPCDHKVTVHNFLVA